MSLSHALFQLLIAPLQLIYEFVYYYAKLFTDSTGMAIIILGLVINLLLLPLYRQADAIQDAERAKEKQMEHWVRHIKKTFSGSERFMMLQTYYRQCGYKPYYALKGMLPLVLEVPFFIAAYSYLSGLGDLHTSFAFISDLSKPDALLSVNGLTINILPIIMTLVNIISGAIYTKGLRIKDKIQLYGMAALFLILLYDSPSGLLVYWTVNNLFSLVKNLVTKMHNRKIINICLASTGMILVICSLVMPKKNFREAIPLMDIGLLLIVPSLIPLLKEPLSKYKSRIKDHTPRTGLFISGCLLMTIITGLLTPSSVIASSPEEFVFYANFNSPLLHLVNSFLLAAGMFLVWFGIFYYLMNRRARWFAGILIWVMSGFAAINSVFFGTRLGNMSSDLEYDDPLTFSTAEHLINIAVLSAAAVLLFLIWKKSKRIVRSIYLVLCLAVTGMSVSNVIRIKASDQMIMVSVDNVRRTNDALEANGGKLIHLSTTQPNVIVIMLDRAAGCFMRFMLQEKPELKEMFDGFTYYRNTLSYGRCTNLGAPPLYGGYEYTPAEMNARPELSLKEKQNEALRVMPLLFDDNNYDVTVIEPTYANYSWVPDLSIFDDRPSIKAYNSEQGQFNKEWLAERSDSLERSWARNFFCYGIMRAAPCFMQAWLYQGSNYYQSSLTPEDENKTVNYYKAFLNCYSVLEALPSITSSGATDKGTFLMMSNSTTHEPTLLKEPDYVPDPYLDNTAYDNTHADRFIYEGVRYDVENSGHYNTYHVDMAAMLRLGEWFAEMRKNGTYDNTRIIIIADHAAPLGIFDELILDETYDISYFVPLFLVKDFNSKGFTIDDTFMTQADTPSLAFEGLIENPVNPSTGKPINTDAKKGDQLVCMSAVSDIKTNNGNTFMPSEWYAVHDNIFDKNNWTKAGYH